MNRVAGALLALTGTIALAAAEAMYTMRPIPDYLRLLAWLEIAGGAYLLVRGEL